MTTLAIELNDASIALASASGVIATEPGCAIATADGLAFGEAALRASRLRPRDANDRYWVDLSGAPLAKPISNATTAADLAHAQLQQLWQRFGDATDEVLFAVPGSFDRERLALLLGIADACEMPVRGLVDAAVAACDCAYPGWDSIHLEAQLHGIGLTRIGASRRAGVDESIAESFEFASSIGLAHLRERWARKIAAAFVAQTRFDPLSDGKTEQRLFDALPDWLEAFIDVPSATVEFDLGQSIRSIHLQRQDLVDEASDVYDLLAERVVAARRPGRGLAVRVGAVLAGLPGAVDRLVEIPGVRVVALPAGAGALGALACADAIRSSPGRTALVRSCAYRAPARELPALQADELEGASSEPTHLLIGNRAHPIGKDGLALRCTETGRLEVLRSPDAEHADFALRSCEDGIRLEFVERTNVKLNTKPAESGVRLCSGDRIAADGCNEEARLIAVSDDGA